MSQPQPPMGPPPGYYRRRRGGGIVWPVLLMAAGTIFLLQNLGLLTWDVWRVVGQFWPVILILIGLELFLGSAGRHVFGAAMGGILALALAAAVAVAVFGHFSAASDSVSSRTFTQTLEGANAVHAVVQFGAGNLNIGPLQDETGQLAQMTYDGPDRLRPQPSYRVRSGEGQLAYQVHGGGPPWRLPFGNGSSGNSQMDLLLSQQVPLTLDVQEGASSGTLDLSKLRVGSFDLQTGASHTSVIMPQNAGSTVATIKGGAASIDVQIPDGVAAQIQYDGGLSTVNVDQTRFPQNGARSYRSLDYDTAQSKIDLTIQAGVSTISVR